ncbi:MAG: DUF3810 domain-containing protein [Daejeonella sp.]
MSDKSRLRRGLTWVAACSLVLALIFSMKAYPDFTEAFYSQGLHRLIRGGVQFLFNYVPFSIGDLLYITIIGLLLSGLYRLVRFLAKKEFRHAGLLFLGFIVKLQIAVCAFYFLWALNYFRQPAAERLGLLNYEYDQEQLLTVTSMLIDSANASRQILGNEDMAVSNQEILKPAVEAINSLKTFNPPLPAIKPAAKKSLLSPLLNYLGTAGYYNPFTGEAHFNSLMPVFTRPFVACHEMAHQMGFGTEDEANFIGFIAGKSSGNALLKYSAYYLAAQEFMAEAWRVDSTAFKKMREKISPAVLEDLQTEREYWTRYQGDAARLSSIFYDNYLKANKQPAGMRTYNKMIRLSMAYYRREGLIN